MSKRKRGALDPDYRTKGWRNSSYAPKKGQLRITDVATLATVLVILIFYLIPELRRPLLNIRGLVIGAIGAFIFWIVTAVLVRRLEWRRVNKPPTDEA